MILIVQVHSRPGSGNSAVPQDATIRARLGCNQSATFDAVVIGAGVAGLSLAANLAPDHKVAVLEQEDAPGFHSTGRSAAVWAGSYGNAVIRELTAQSLRHFRDPAAGFCDTPLLTQRGILFIARADQRGALDAFQGNAKTDRTMRSLDAAQARELFPLLRPGYAEAALWDETGADIDVHALLQGYLRIIRRHGGAILTDCRVRHAEHRRGLWSVQTTGGAFEAPLLINAGGAWADAIAHTSGVAPLGLRPLRRTAFTIELAANALPARSPVLIDIDEGFYAKAEAGALLCSPADETESPPCDARPEDLDIAIGVDRLEKALDISVRTIGSRWAGLRTFAEDRSPVVGFDAQREGFFWLAGQGGYGVQTAPGIAELAGDMIRRRSSPHSDGALSPLVAALEPRRLPSNRDCSPPRAVTKV